ncbi:MAG: potassium-transporting ATPase subunit KdpA, partial [Oscillospiraceae bacterium]
MTQSSFQYILYLLILVVLAYPLGMYIAKVMNGEKTALTKAIAPWEKAIYKL